MRGRGLCLLGGMMLGQAAAQRNMEMEQQAQQDQAQAYQQGMHAQAAVTPAPRDTVAELQKCAEMHCSGVLTDEEFAAAKKKLLT